MIRVSSTTLESFRRVVEYDYGDERELIDSILGKPYPVRWQMAAGQAWHSVLEHPVRTGHISLRDGLPVQMHRSGGYLFDGSDVYQAGRIIGPGLWEVKASKILDVWGVPVTVVAKADHVHGLILQDNKTKFSPADPRDYEPSLQWRLYCLIHGAAVFRYLLWSFADPDDVGHCRLKDVTTFKLWPYVGLEQDCRAWLGRFLDWCHAHRLTEHLDQTRGSPLAPEAA